MAEVIEIDGRMIGQGHPVYIIAEMSANHGQDFDEAVRIIKAAKESGADAIKLQTYTPDTLTMDSNSDYFQVKNTIWEGRTLYELYGEAYTSWDWHARLQKVAIDVGLEFFSTPFDATAVAFLEDLHVPVYKVASFEIVDLPLLEHIARTGKPVIMSTGMASLAEIEEAVTTLRSNGTSQLALLKCTSGYPALAEEMDLRTIPHLSEAFGVVTGLSDHSMGTVVPVVAVTLGASIVEKHLTMDRSVPGPDNSFSLEPHEFAEMVNAIRVAEKAVGQVNYDATPKEQASRFLRRSLFVVEDMVAGERFTSKNLRSIRPGYGLHTRYYAEVISGEKANEAITKGTPLSWDLVG